MIISRIPYTGKLKKLRYMIPEQIVERERKNFELHIRCLKTAENLVLAAMRSWVGAMKDGRDPLPGIEDSFSAARIRDVAKAFDTLMLITTTSTSRPTDIRCLSSSTLGKGELDILAVISFIQTEKIHWAYSRLLTWLPPAAAKRAFAKSRVTAKAMSNVDLDIELRDEYLCFELAHGVENINPSPGMVLRKTLQ